MIKLKAFSPNISHPFLAVRFIYDFVYWLVTDLVTYDSSQAQLDIRDQ